MNNEEMQNRIFGFYDPHLPPGSWKDTIINTAMHMEEQHFMTDKITSMVKENRLYAFQGLRKHPESIMRMKSIMI